MIAYTLKQLEVFVSVAENKSFSLAADSLYMNQSTVSTHVASLEKEIGFKLIERGKRKKFSLTEEGKLVYGFAKDIIDKCSRMNEEVMNSCRNKISIGVSSVPAQCVLPGIMAGFLNKGNTCDFIIHKGDSMRVHDMLLKDSIHIGMAGTMIRSDGLQYYPIIKDELIVITANNDHYKKMKEMNAAGEDLLYEPMILREKESGSRKEFEKYLLASGIKPAEMKVVAEIDHPMTIIEYVCQGIGVSVVSSLTAEHEIKNGRILGFQFSKRAFRNIFLMHKNDAELNETERELIRYILGVYKLK